MSIQAQAWAIEQAEVPARPALVLIALANHASHVDGRCWPSIELIAREARCSRRAVFGYIAALERNGYVEVQRTRKKSGRQGTNNYWLIFNRDSKPWAHLPGHEEIEPPITEEDAEAVEAAEENNSTSGVSANIAPQIQSADLHPGKPPEIPSPGIPECKAGAPGQSATVCTRHVMPEPSDSRTSEQVEGRALRIGVPVGYRPKARTEQAASKIATEDEPRSKRIPVFEGSDPWNYWIKHGHPATLTTWFEHEGKRRKGWWFPSLYPPKSTGPPSKDDRRGKPSEPDHSPEKTNDISELADEMGR